MPTGMRCSVIALALCSLIGGAQAAGPASTWSDPPARKTEADRPGTSVPRPSPPAVAERRPDPPPGMAVSRRNRMAVRRVPAKARIAVRAEHRIATRTGRRPRPMAVMRRPVAMARMIPHRPPFALRVYPGYRAVDYPLDYEDARLERLSTAVHSGYLVMRRRTVEYPDGRVIRIYRPADEGDGD